MAVCERDVKVRRTKPSLWSQLIYPHSPFALLYSQLNTLPVLELKRRRQVFGDSSKVIHWMGESSTLLTHPLCSQKEWTAVLSV